MTMYARFVMKCAIKTHGNVLCGLRKWDTPKCIDGSNKLVILHIRISVMSSPNGTKFTLELASMHAWVATFQIQIRSFKLFPRYQSAKFLRCFSGCLSSVFCTLCKSCYNLCMLALIWLKFGTPIGGLKVNTSVKLGVNPQVYLINNEGVISEFTVKILWDSRYTSLL